MNVKKKFRLSDAVLTVICAVFDAEASAPVASIGNSQYFWWILMIVAFLIPFGLISSELGTAYDGNGGIYNWILAAYPKGKTAGRVAWYYWINFALWLASLFVLSPNLISYIMGIRIGFVLSILIQMAFIWIVVFISAYPVCESVWILNSCTVIKVLLAVIMGTLGIYGAATNGIANAYTAQSLLPSVNLHSFSFISVIIFNCLGFEVVCTFMGNMEDPKKQIPKSIFIGAIAVAAINIYCAFGIGVAIPCDKITAIPHRIA